LIGRSFSLVPQRERERERERDRERERERREYMYRIKQESPRCANDRC